MVMNVSAHIAKAKLLAMTLLAAAVVASCDEVIYDGEGDCSVKYRIEFEYSRNMEFDDAFASKVGSVSLYVFDNSGVLVDVITQSGAALAAEDYAIGLELAPAHYTLLAWCGVDGQSFSVPEAVVGTTTIEQMQCRLNSKSDSSGAYSDSDLNNLFHGVMELDYSDVPGLHTEVMSLTKNTNNFRILLQQTWSEGTAAEYIDYDDFNYAIVDNNALLEYDNTLPEQPTITYRPWAMTAGKVDSTSQVAAVRSGDVYLSVAELTTSRLVVGNSPQLIITRKSDGGKVLSLPIIDYALVAKGQAYGDMDAQEYLDRQDEYNMTFFLHNGQWMSAQIIINSWVVVINNENL